MRNVYDLQFVNAIKCVHQEICILQHLVLYGIWGIHNGGGQIKRHYAYT